jgi:predicted nucleotidyltransferase
MLKEGKYRALRNIPVGWVLQALHSTDTSERYFRIAVELALLTGMFHLVQAMMPDTDTGHALLLSFVATHTAMWFLTGNFWVYMLDSFLWVKNPGVQGLINFINAAKKSYLASDSVDAILIYGSMCRFKLHGRSDLDLRVVRRRDSWRGMLALPIGLVLRSYSFFRAIPVDLEVVDSMEFVRRQMRSDERPIAVFIREGLEIAEMGVDFDEIVENPSIVMRDGQA